MKTPLRTRSVVLAVAVAALLGLLAGRRLGSSGSDSDGPLADGSRPPAGPAPMARPGLPQDGAPGAAPAAAPAAATVWTCSMHPQIRVNGPGRCPICGMDLVPAAAAAADGPAVTLSPSAQRIASIEVAPVARRELEHELRAVGRIEMAEPLVAYLTARTPARVERVWADFTGTTVAAGDHLVDLYSPELVVAQQELLAAPTPDLAALARRKLAQWGVTDVQLDEIAASGKPRSVVTLHAPIGGIVIEKDVVEGQYVAEGDPLYTIADLSTVWLKVGIYEFELPWVAIGQAASVQVAGVPGLTFAGTVAFVDPVVDEASRTVRVRINLPNPDARLKPGMFADATLRARLLPDGTSAPSPLAGLFVCPMHPDVTSETAGACRLCGMDLRRVEGEREPAGPPGVLAVPASAVLDTGLRRIVYVEEQPGRYAAREVALGPRAGEHYPVLSGLAEGERVVVHGGFLLDSQSQIEGRPSLLFPNGLVAGPGAHAGH